MKGVVIALVAGAIAVVLFILYKRNSSATTPTGGSGSKSSFDRLCQGAAVAGAAYAGGAQAGTEVAKNDNLTSGACGLLKDGLQALGKGAEFLGKKTLQGVEAVGGGIKTGAKAVGSGIATGAKATGSAIKKVVTLDFGDKDVAGVAGIGSGSHAQVQAKINEYVDSGKTLTPAQKAQIAGDDGGPGGRLYVPSMTAAQKTTVKSVATSIGSSFGKSGTATPKAPVPSTPAPTVTPTTTVPAFAPRATTPALPAPTNTATKNLFIAGKKAMG